MAEVRSRRLLQRALRISQLAPWAAFVVACGGTSLVEAPVDQGASAAGGRKEHAAGAGGSAAASGAVGDTAGSSGAGAAGASGSAGKGSAGAGGSGGSGASAGSGGTSDGSGGDSGSAGMGLAGSSGNSAVCHANPPQVCAGGAITLPKTCVPEASASVGTSLPIATCRTMCESMFTFSCTVSAVQQTSITVQCTTGCPAAHE